MIWLIDNMSASTSFAIEINIKFIPIPKFVANAPAIAAHEIKSTSAENAIE